MFKCIKCLKTYSFDDKIIKCTCGSLLDFEFYAEFPLEKIRKRKPSLWRYEEAIPIENKNSIVTFDEGFTPLLKMKLRGAEIHFKLDYMFPTGSFKDRGSTVMISKIKEIGIKGVIEDSSGNAGASIASYCANAGIECTIYIPEKTSIMKSRQIELYNAKLVKINGSREDTAEAALEASKNVYYASHVFNPFFLHGTKTIAYEIAEQLDWKSPDAVIMPVGNGSLFLGAYIGFRDLLNCGITVKMPKLIAVQAENCSPIYTELKRSQCRGVEKDKKETIAEGIAIRKPVRSKQIIDAIKESKGDCFTVTEREIIDAFKAMSGKGLFIEYTSAVAVAGIDKYMNSIVKRETIVTVITGNGLKNSRLENF